MDQAPVGFLARQSLRAKEVKEKEQRPPLGERRSLKTLKIFR